MRRIRIRKFFIAIFSVVVVWLSVNCRATEIARIKNADEIDLAAYPRIKDGHLWANGKRLKLWGSQGNFGTDFNGIDGEVKRFRKLGFNLFRPLSVTSVIPPDDYDYTPGDGAKMERLDYYFAAIANSGGYLWFDMLNSFRITPDYADLISDPYISKKEWLESIEKLKDGRKGKANLQPTGGLMYWDLRSREAYMRYIDKMMTHRNPYRGLTYAEDPSVAVIELMNEQWWLPRALGGAVFVDLPWPLMHSLLKHWNEWLTEKYKDTSGLRQAWGALLPNESLEKQTVLLQPLKGKAAADKMSDVLGISANYAEGMVVDVPESGQRKSDVVRFLMKLHLDFCQEAIARIRSHGKPGRGAAVVPVVIDTGASFAMQSQFEHSFGSALACATYVHQFNSGKSISPWRRWLNEPPYFNDWVDQNKIEGHPSFMYELMYFPPGKYRADFALRLLGMVTIQDFDIVDWHYYQPYQRIKDWPLCMPKSRRYTNGLIYGNDEVSLATILLSSAIFRYGNLQAPKTPTVLEIGDDFLYNMDNLHWGKFRKFLSSTVFQHGLRLRFNHECKKTRFIGPFSDGENVPETISPTPEITYHWKKGYMTIESERVRLLAGYLPKDFTFSNGEKLVDITVNNPEGTPFVVPGERYVCFAMCSRDGKPLEKSRDIVAMAVSTSWNTGFEFDYEKWLELQKKQNHAPINAAKSLKHGTLPILVSRVGWTFDAPWLKGLKTKQYNFALDVYKQKEIEGTQFAIGNTEKLFFVELSR